MDKRSLRNKKSKHRSSRTHERPNQGILGRVASKVKGILGPWFSSVWNTADDPSCSSEDDTTQEHSPQITLQSNKRPRLSLHEHSSPSCSSSVLHTGQSVESNFNLQSSRGIKRPRITEHSIQGRSTSIYSDNSGEKDYSNSPFDSKRQKLRLPDHILSPGTQAWLEESDRPNIFSQSSHHVSPSNAQNSLLENKDSSVILNGDDHSENSEGSASTSGCSSLVSHKDRTSCISSILDSDIKIRRDAAKQKELSGDISSNRLSLWSTRASPSIYRSPSASMRSSQPGFCLSAFNSPKLSQQADKKVSSPFYQGRTTFGGASASRRMPIAAAPYQVDKPLRNQLKIRSTETNDYESMSSAAKRILQTLEKMSSPVTDAKKIPNTNKSPVDLSLYLMPPKQRRNMQSTPSGPIKGPPIADISTISRLTTIKSYSQRKFQNTSLDSSTLIGDSVNNTISSLLPEITKSSSPSPSQPSGGGKMKTKLNQQHKPSVKCKYGTNVSEMESRMSEYIDLISETNLPEMPLPIVSLPTIKFGNSTPKTSNELKQSGKDFVFSNPIEHVMPNSSLTSHTSSSNNSMLINSNSSMSTTPLPSVSQRTVKLSNSFIQSTNSVDKHGSDFTFSNPIEHVVPNALLSSPEPLSVKIPLEKSKSTFTFGTNNTTPNLFCSTTIETPKAGSKHSQDIKSTSINSMFGKTADKLEKEHESNVSLNTTSSCTVPLSQLVSKTPTWECDVCMIRNDMNVLKCVACEAPKPKKYLEKSETSTNSSAAPAATAGFKIGFQSLTSSTVSTLEASKEVCTFGSKMLSQDAASKSSSDSEIKPKMEKINKTTEPSLFQFKPTKPVWECDVCLVRNDMDKQKCVACESIRSNEKLTAPKIQNAFSQSLPIISTVSTSATTASGFQFGTKSIASTSTTTASGFQFGTKSIASTSTTASGFQFGTKSIPSTSTTTVSGFQFGTKSIAENISTTTTESTKPVFTFGSKVLSTDSVPVTSSETSTAGKVDSIESSAPSAFTKPSENSNNLLSNTTSVSNASVFKLGSTISSDMWECSACLTKNDKGKDQCKSCDAVKSQKGSSDDTPKVTSSSPSTFSVVSTVQQATDIIKALSENTKPVFLFGAKNNSSNPLLEVKNNSSNPLIGFKENSQTPLLVSVNDKSKTENTSELFKTPSVQSAFSKPSDKSAISSVFTSSVVSSSSSASTPAPVFRFGVATSSIPSSCWECSSCKIKNEGDKPKCSSCSTERQKAEPTGLSLPITSSVAFQFANTATASSAPSSVSPAATKFSFGIKPESTNPLLKSNTENTTTSTLFGQNSVASAFGGGSINKPLSAGFSFSTGSVPSSSTPAPVFQFGTKAKTTDIVRSCASCQGKCEEEKLKCNVCHPEKSVSGLTFKANNEVKTSVPAMSFNNPATTTTSGFTFTASAPASTGGFVFGAKSEPATSTPAVFSFGSAFKANNEVKPSVPVMSFNNPATATTTSGFTFNASAPASTSGFVFGVKSEPVTSTPAVFTFGSAATKSSFEQSPAPAATFQFQSVSGTGSSASTFGTPNSTFAFTPKSENVIQPAAVTQTPSFGNTPTQPMFGNAATTPAFGKQAPGGFNFTLPAASNPPPTPVFQFGTATEKKQATPSTGGFQFATPEASTFQPQFNLSTPTAFNFGSGSPAGPFQFA